jgi:hypothetical protein
MGKFRGTALTRKVGTLGAGTVDRVRCHRWGRGKDERWAQRRAGLLRMDDEREKR